MIKIKVTREQLGTLCSLTNPAVYEAKVSKAIADKNFRDIDTLFNLIQVGETLSKKWIYSLKNSYKISFKHAEAASLFKQLTLLQWDMDDKSFEHNVSLMVTQELHHQLTNYQRRFYGQTTGQNLITGGVAGAGAPVANIAG